MNPHRSSLASAILLVSTISAPVASAALTLVNGDFQNTAGLTVNSPNTWYGGVPAGWQGLANSYTVGTNGNSNWVANLEWVSSTSGGFRPLYQDLGTLDTTSTISLTFTVLQPWNTNAARVGAAIWGGSSGTDTLVTQSDLAPGTYTITAENVAAGTEIRIGFWRSRSNNSPGLDNVSILVTPVPEPSLPLLSLLSLVPLLRRSRRRSA